MSAIESGCGAPRRSWALALGLAVLVAAVQFWFVVQTTTDVPFDDQWDREGGWLYPRWLDGTWRWGDLLVPHNEHHIVWTHLLNLTLFEVNGQWDPQVQLMAIVLLRAVAAGILTLGLATRLAGRQRWLLVAGVALLMLPHLAWHNVQWGFQTQVYFCLGLSIAALWLLAADSLSWWRWSGGVLLGAAAQLAMSAGGLVPLALAGLFALHVSERRVLGRTEGMRAAAWILLGSLAWWGRVSVAEHESLRAGSIGEFFTAFGQAIAWPYPGIPIVGIFTLLPLVAYLVARIGRRDDFSRDDVVLAWGIFALAGAFAQAALRGGGDEFTHGVPSRYVDFLVPLVLVNGWCVMVLWNRLQGKVRRLVRIVALAWLLVVGLGWATSSVQTWNSAVRWRMNFRELPVELVRAYQVKRDPMVFDGYRQWFVPHPSISAMGRVLWDPRLDGRLPPSFQPERPLGPLSRATRSARAHVLGWVAFGVGLAAACWVVVARRRQLGGESAGDSTLSS